MTKDVAEEALCGARKLLSAQERVEELGESKYVRSSARGINSSSVEIPPSFSQENKDAATLGSSGKVEPTPQVLEHSMLFSYTQVELVDFGS